MTLPLNVGTLGDTEARLAKFLQLQGKIPLALGGIVQPVVVVGEAQGEGYVRDIQRRFGYGTAVAAGGAGNVSSYALKCLSGEVVIQRHWLRAGAATGVATICWDSPNNADPYAMATTGVIWLDRQLVSTEIAPLTTGQKNGTAAAPGTIVWQGMIPSGGFVVVDLPVHLVTGARLIYNMTTANTQLDVSFMGNALF